MSLGLVVHLMQHPAELAADEVTGIVDISPEKHGLAKALKPAGYVHERRHRIVEKRCSVTADRHVKALPGEGVDLRVGLQKNECQPAALLKSKYAW